MTNVNDNGPRTSKRKQKSRSRHHARSVWANLKPHNNGYELHVAFSIVATKAASRSHLAKMPPDIDVWPRKRRNEWLQQLIAGARLHELEGAEGRFGKAYVDLLAALLAGGERQERQLGRTHPKPDLRIVGGTESAFR